MGERRHVGGFGMKCGVRASGAGWAELGYSVAVKLVVGRHFIYPTE